MPLVLAILAQLWASLVYAEAEYLGTFVWNMPHPDFGGISGIDVEADGKGFVAVSDSGFFLVGEFERAGELISNVVATDPIRMLDVDGRALRGVARDSEGIAVTADGRIFVSFEGVHAFKYYLSPTGPANVIPGHPEFERFQKNSSVEALAIDERGRLYTMPERSGRANRPFPVYRSEGAFWTQPFEIPRSGAFLVVGADVGPDGRLYVLERDFTGIGFRSRVRSFTTEGEDERMVFQSTNAKHDNLEGISVWRDSDGRLRLTMIADDNYRWFQQTEIVEYRLTE